MNLGELRPAKGSRRAPKRKGRGIGSGLGKTSGRGHNGQRARNTVRPGFEGGQTPLHKRLPQQRGFKNARFKKEFAIVNLERLAQAFESGAEVTPEILLQRRIVRDLKDGIKILGEGDLPHPLTVRAHRFSKSAEEKLRAAGGTAEVI
jgi:large subunit ribosomal protein L15